MDDSVKRLLEFLPPTKQTTYVSFQVEKKDLNVICLNRGLAASTLHGHLESAILVGLPVSYDRLGVSLNDVAAVERKIRQPPINSSKFDLETFFFGWSINQLDESLYGFLICGSC
jgi:hypothetical protein